MIWCSHNLRCSHDWSYTSDHREIEAYCIHCGAVKLKTLPISQSEVDARVAAHNARQMGLKIQGWRVVENE